MYDEAFFEEEGPVARRAARVVIPTLAGRFPFQTVLDIGAGTGEWAAACRELGKMAWTIDHDVPPELLVAPEWHINLDLNSCWVWWPTDLAICVEVAEHLSPHSGPELVYGLSRAKRVLFSAATPGQSGHGHVNCRPHAYWHVLFEKYGYTPTYIGNQFGDQVAGFYRNNLFLYSREAWFRR